MLENEYRILGVSPSASDEELESAFVARKQRLEEDRFLDGDAGNEAAKELTELITAYNEIKSFRAEHARINEEGAFKDIDGAIKSGDLKKAQELLDSFNDRPAEWHYMQAVVYYKKNWMNESKKQLEIAKEMEPSNEKYIKTYDRLVGKMQSESTDKHVNDQRFRSGSTGGGAYGTSAGYDDGQMGGDTCLDFCCSMAICNLCSCFCRSCR